MTKVLTARENAPAGSWCIVGEDNLLYVHIDGTPVKSSAGHSLGEIKSITQLKKPTSVSEEVLVSYKIY